MLLSDSVPNSSGSLASSISLATQASGAGSFVSSIGVNAHIDSGYPNWDSASTVEAEVAYLGVKNIRDGTPYDWALPIYIALAKTGVRFDLTQENPTAAALTTIGSLQDTQRADTLETAVPSSVKSLEGANEYNISSYNLGNVNSYGNLAWGALDDQNLQMTVAADPILTAAGVLVVAASTSGPTSIPVIGPYVNASNWHVYGGVGQQLAQNMAAGVAAARASAPGKPVYVTETGISTSGYASSFWGVADPYTQGVIDTNALLDAYNDGASKTFIYDLMDDTNQSSAQENHFGLFNADGTPKPSATDIRNLISLLSGNNNPLQLGTLRYGISGLPSTAYSMLLEKPDGTFDIVVWNGNATLYNGISDVTPPETAVTIAFGSDAQEIDTYDPIVGQTAQQRLTDTASVSFGLSADPIIVEVVPAGAPTIIGTGPDSFVLNISEDAYANHDSISDAAGNANFKVFIDGKQQGGVLTATALHKAGADQTFTIEGTFGAGAHTVSVQFINDAWNPGKPDANDSIDRNLYVDDISYNGNDLHLSAFIPRDTTSNLQVPAATPTTMTVADDTGAFASIPIITSGTSSFTGSLDTTVKQSVANGTDTVSFDSYVGSETMMLGSGVQSFTFQSPVALFLTGGSGTDTVTATSGPHRNVFTAGTGSLDASGGNDGSTYFFHAKSGTMKIEDFNFTDGDSLGVDKSLQGAFKCANDGRGGSLLTFGTTGSIDLVGHAAITAANISWI